eukprot:Phypoly_transcript_06963.p1 GENE.Phypoly_transcript_06963~~Phypoly_transcript_06963.p1  ORF type:complete len:475 (+),score=67.53 Phypoly_transcript_06963:172-1596(+)
MSTASTPTRSQVIMAHIFCVAQQFTSVTVYVLGKKIMATVDVYHFIFMRLLFVIPFVLVASALFTRRFAAFRMPLKTWGYIVISGVVGIFVSQSLIFVGLDKSTPINASIISAPCTPLFTALFSVLRGIDKMNVPKGLGFLSSIIGALLLLQVWNFEFKGKTMGNLLIVGSAVLNAFNSIVQKHVLNEGHHPLVIQFYVCCVGIVSYIAGYTWFGLFTHESWMIPGNVWVYISIVGVVATALPWCVSIIALKHTSPMTTSVYVVLQPLIAGFVGVVLLGDIPTWIQMIGGALVILGLVLVNAQPIVQKLFYRTKAEFALLPTEEAKETEEIELKVITDKPDSTGDVTKPTEEVKYDLTPTGETNAFVIEDPPEKDGADETPDYKPVEGIFTPEFVRHRHEHEEAEGYNFSVTLHKSSKPDDVIPVMPVKQSEKADYVDGADYYTTKEPKTDFYASSCRNALVPETPTPTLRPIV